MPCSNAFSATPRSAASPSTRPSTASASPDPDEREPRFLTWEEADELQAWLPEPARRIVPIAILTMLRRGEILGLRDRDVDLEADSITILGQTQGSRRVSTKTQAGRRTVDIGPATAKLMREQRLARTNNEEGLLFPGHPSGAPLPGRDTALCSGSSSRPPARPGTPS